MRRPISIPMQLCTLAAIALLGCFPSPSDPGGGPADPLDGVGSAPPVDPLPDADLKVLFIGNSLTASNDLPGMVADVAEAAGHTFSYRAVIRSGSSLEDHWKLGVEQTILASEADFVVMQQGPSSVGDNPAHLQVWTDTLAGAIRAAGGEPALLMVWPESTRMQAFDAVRDSYARAAAAVGGVFIPAGESWRAIWALRPDAPLYGTDGFHPSRAGSFVAAVTVHSVLFGETPTELPAPLLGIADAALYYDAIATAVEPAATR